MNQTQQFHGSDLHQISTYYSIPIEDIINLAGNVNPLGMSPNFLDYTRNHLSLLSDYPDRNYTSLRQSISNYCQSSFEHIIVGNGTSELISLLINNLGTKKALQIGPTYSEYEREIKLAGGTLHHYLLKPQDDFQLSLDLLYSELNGGYDFLVICNPNNPTGTALDTQQLSAILDYCHSHNVFVMVDETYIEFSSNLSSITAVPLVDNYNNLIILRGTSKFFAVPGLRFGYGITSNKQFLNHLKSVQNPWSLNSIAANAGHIMFEDIDYIEATKSLIESEKNYIYSQLNASNKFRLYKSEANFILLQSLDASLTASNIFEHCIKQKLMIRNCDSFFKSDGEFIRFCIGLPQQNKKLIQTLKGIDSCIS